MNYGHVELDDQLLRAVEEHTDDLDHRDEWIQNAVTDLLDRGDLPDRPELDRDEYHRLVVQRAIQRKLVC